MELAVVVQVVLSVELVFAAKLTREAVRPFTMVARFMLEIEHGYEVI